MTHSSAPGLLPHRGTTRHALVLEQRVGDEVRALGDLADLKILGLPDIVANLASAALIARLGFERIAVQPLGYEMSDGALVDGIGYAMTDPSALPPLQVSWNT